MGAEDRRVLSEEKVRRDREEVLDSKGLLDSLELRAILEVRDQPDKMASQVDLSCSVDLTSIYIYYTHEY